MAFLSIITRTMPNRPTMLERNQESLARQTCQDFDHLVFTDEACRGNHWAQRWVTDLVHQATGEYIMILDDDDYMLNKQGVEILKFSATYHPRGVLFRAMYTPKRIFPVTFDAFQEVFWDMGHIGQLSYILRNDIFKESCYVYRRGVDETDWLCLLDAYENAQSQNALEEFVLREEIINAAQRPDSRGEAGVSNPYIFQVGFLDARMAPYRDKMVAEELAHKKKELWPHTEYDQLIFADMKTHERKRFKRGETDWEEVKE